MLLRQCRLSTFSILIYVTAIVTTTFYLLAILKLSLYASYDTGQNCAISQKLIQSRHQTPSVEMTNARYLGIDFETHFNGRLGNQLFLIASIFGAAKTLNRIPFISYTADDDRLTLLKYARIVKIFPNLADAYRVLLISQEETKMVAIGMHRQAYYDDLDKYRKYDNEKYIWADTTGTYMESYKYFQSYRSQLLNHYLLFRRSYIDEANGFLKKFAINDAHLWKRNTICVHIRRTDFLKIPLAISPSKMFVRKSVQYIRNLMGIKNREPSTVFLMSDDYSFVKTIFERNKDNISAYTLLINHERPAVHWAFAMQYCSAIILTMSRSTFGWWMAYLSANATIYYNNYTESGGQTPEEIQSRLVDNYQWVRDDYFPPEWIALSVSETSGFVSQIRQNSIN